MSNHDHSDNFADQIRRIALDANNSPEATNRIIGVAMQHMGATLSNAAVPYLGISPNEIMVEPEIMGDSHDAVLLTTRMTRSANSAMLMVNWMTSDDQIHYDLLVYQPDEFNLTKTSFIGVPDEVATEIKRQVGVILTNNPNKTGSLLLNYTLSRNYFPAVASTSQPVEQEEQEIEVPDELL